MKFKVLLRKRGGARARAAGRELFLEIRPLSMVHAFYVYLSCFMTRHAVVWELVELSSDRSKRVGSGGMAGHAGPPVGPASDVVLLLHSLKKRGAT